MTRFFHEKEGRLAITFPDSFEMLRARTIDTALPAHISAQEMNHLKDLVHKWSFREEKNAPGIFSAGFKKKKGAR